jgi:hypothetical protein
MPGASIRVLGLWARGLMTVETLPVVPIVQAVQNVLNGTRRSNDSNCLNRERGESELNGAPFGYLTALTHWIKLRVMLRTIRRMGTIEGEQESN